MKISTVEPKPRPTRVIIEMTDAEACEIRDFLSPDDISKRQHPEMHKLMALIHELTGEW